MIITTFQLCFPKNKWQIERKLQSNGKYSSVILKYPGQSIDPNEITLGGFLTKKQKNKLGPLGPYNIFFQDKQTNQIVKSPISIQKKIYKKKKFLEGQANEIFSKYIWFLKSNNYLNAENIKGKKIFLQGDSKEKVYLKTFRGEELNKSGFTSSWLKSYPKTNLEKFTHYVYQPFISKENLVEITRGPLYHIGYSLTQ